MATYLEQLISEYLTERGYWVQLNWRPSQHGGDTKSKDEFDVVALDMETRTLWHYEASSGSWESSCERDYITKFTKALQHYGRMFPGVHTPTDIRRFAVFEEAKRRQFGGPPPFEVVSLQEFVREIEQWVDHDYMKKSIPERFPLLRTIQMYRWASKRNERSVNEPNESATPL
ncbi:MAG: hypothetical protein RBS39_08365 [Phycisphaerales bacterium]|nr:hypothetical protein [Phycisphaerales bacterium]